jgi:uncharacterized membrane protein
MVTTVQQNGRAVDVGTERLTQALGWFSLGLGLAPIGAPERLSRQVGVDDSRTATTVLRAVGAREILHASGLLLRHPLWVWTRVAGDAMDLTMLARALAHRSGWRRRRTALATAAIVGITAADVYAAARISAASARSQHSSTALASGSRLTRGKTLDVKAAITISRPVEEVYGYWHQFENLPNFMAHLESVRDDGARSHWVAKAPAGRTVEWDAEVTEDVPNERISWRSVEKASVSNSGTVRFAPAPKGRGTEVRVEMQYSPPGGAVGAAVAKLFGEEPNQQVRDDLRRLKQVLETGQVSRSEGSPEGTKAFRQLAQHPAQPHASVG